MSGLAQSGTWRGFDPKRWAALAAILVCAGCGSSGDGGGKKGATKQPTHAPDASAEHDAATHSPADAADAGATFVACEPEALKFGPNVAMECERCAPHGTCPADDPEQGECRCDPEYSGTRCERCADGFVEHEGQCVTPCQAAGLMCPGASICTGAVDAPACECSIGVEGANCDRCSSGFVPATGIFDSASVVCVPTCDGGCETAELCSALSRDEQRCECTDGYERNADGTCEWQGFTADPRFEHGCADWHLFRRVANPTDHVVTEIAPSLLTLSVDHRCSDAIATAVAFLPARATMPNAAVAITAFGTTGASLRVGFDQDLLPGLPGGEHVTGTGDFHRYVVCLPLSDQGRQAAITLSVGENGTCAEALDATFRVRSVVAVPADECAPTGN